MDYVFILQTRRVPNGPYSDYDTVYVAISLDELRAVQKRRIEAIVDELKRKKGLDVTVVKDDEPRCESEFDDSEIEGGYEVEVIDRNSGSKYKYEGTAYSVYVGA